jgi:hypothetical protein
LSTNIRDWLAALSILALYSFLYKENPVYRFAEHLFVGIAAGHAISMAFGNVRDVAVRPAFRDGKVALLIPCLLGILLFFRFSRKYAWLARYPIALITGIGSGMALRGIPSSQILAQVAGIFVPLTSISNIILVVGVIGTLVYFLFTKEHKGAVGTLASVGKWIMMISFGATFGTTIFERLSLFIGTLNTVLGDWLGLIQ